MNAPSYVFDSPAERIVEYKWDNARGYVYFENFIYFCLAIFVMLDIWIFSKYMIMKWLLLVCNIILLTKLFIKSYLFTNFNFRRECSYHIQYENNNQFKHNLSMFMNNPYNIFDICGHVLIIIYCTAFIRKNKSSYAIEIIHLVANFSIMIRGCFSTFNLSQ